MLTTIATIFLLSLLFVDIASGFVPSTVPSIIDSASRSERLPLSSTSNSNQHLKLEPVSFLSATATEADCATMHTNSKGSNQGTKKLLLVGGGHGHIQVIKSLNSQARPPNLQITLVDVQSEASYSGMVPGCVAKLYDLEQVQIDLGAIAKWAGIDFICGRMVGVETADGEGDNVQNLALVEVGSCEAIDREDTSQILKIPYDVMSLDIGSATRDFRSVPGASEYAISTRPISELVKKIEKEESLLCKKIENKTLSGPLGIVVVGGGAAGIELSLAMRARWGALSDNGKKMSVTLLDSNDRLVPSESLPCRKAMENVMKKYEIDVKHNIVVTEVTSTHIRVVSTNEDRNSSDDECDMIPYTHCIWATGAESHPLSRELHHQCGLSITARGWIEVNLHLQSMSHPNIFAAGDCCEIVFPTGDGAKTRKSPPKAGVYAVRSGPILIENLTRQLGLGNCNNLVTFNPQEDFLKLLMCGDGTALGFRFGIPLYGKWVWKLKDHIDRKFMDLFDVKNLPVLCNEDSKDDENDCNSKSYDTSQYDAIVEKPPRLDAEHAGKLLLRTDDDVDFQSAWDVLRDMMLDDEYKSNVLKIVESVY